MSAVGQFDLAGLRAVPANLAPDFARACAVLWEKATIKPYVSDDERDFLNEDRFWLCAAKSVEYIVPVTGDDLYDKAMYAAWALQILCPASARHVFLKFENTPEGFDNLGARRPKELCSMRLSFLDTLAAE